MRNAKVFVGAQVDQELKSDLEALANKEMRSVSNLVNKILAEGVAAIKENDEALLIAAEDSQDYGG